MATARASSPASPQLDDRTIETAIALDIDPFSEDHLLWIARAALNDELPPGWSLAPATSASTRDDPPEYVHDATGERRAQHPLADEFRATVARERARHAEMCLSRAHPTPGGLFSAPRPATLGRMGTGRVLVPDPDGGRAASVVARRAFGDALDGNALAARPSAERERKEKEKEKSRKDKDQRDGAGARAAEASRRVAMKGLRRRVAELESALAEREASARLEAAFFEEERAHLQADLRGAIEHERRLAAEEAFKTARAAEAAKEAAKAAARDARTAELEEELAGERRRAEELVAVVTRQSKDLAKGGADVAELRESLERAAEVRTAEARREMEREMERRLRETERLRCRERDADAKAAAEARNEAEATREATTQSLARALEETRKNLEREMNRRVETERQLEEAEIVASNAAPSADLETARALKTAVSAARRDHERLKAEMRQMVATASSDVAEATRRAEALGAAALAAAERFESERRERRRLAEALLELKGNVRVFVRVRPLTSAERDRGEIAALVPSSHSEVRLNPKGGLRPAADARRFEMDAVFGPEASQSTVFEEVAPLVRSALDGYHACIFAYGQTGSGKTHTMEGTEEDRGITFRALSALFREAERERATIQYTFAVEMLEVYNDKVRDLLELDPARPKPHDVRRGPDGNAFVTDLERVPVSSSMDVMRVMRRGTAARKTGRTDMNERSSRSHLVFTVHVVGVHATRGETTRSRLNLVDLAGSERLSKTNATGERLAEAQHINKSLSALGNCMSALATRQRTRKKHGGGSGSAAAGHVPFRDCKLTHILSPCLGGDSKTLMFVHAGPAASEAGESACTLEFASRVRAVELGPARRNVVAATSTAHGDGEALKRAGEEIAAKNRRIEQLTRELEAARG